MKRFLCLIPVALVLFVVALPAQSRGKPFYVSPLKPDTVAPAPEVKNVERPKAITQPLIKGKDYVWRTNAEMAGRWDLYLWGGHIGSWFKHDEGKYFPIARELDGKVKWCDPGDPPVPLPEADGPLWKASKMPDWKLSGVDDAKLGWKDDSYHLALGGDGSHQVSPDVALRALETGRIRINVKAEDGFEGPDLPDDSDKYWLLVIGGTPEVRAKVVADWNTSTDVATIRDKTNVWSVPADHISVMDNRSKQPIYFTNGNPTIYFLAADGTVLHRQDDYAGQGDFRALRKVDPKSYDPAKDKDLRKASDSPFGGKGFPGWLLLSILSALGLVAHQKLPAPPIRTA